MANFFASVTLFFKDQFTAGAMQAKKGFTSMASAAETLGKSNALLDTASKLSMATAMTEPFRQKLSAALEGPSTLAAGLDSTFKNIQSVTGATGAEMAKLQSQLISVGGTSVAGLQATAATYYDIAGGVTDASVRMPTLKAALSMAEAGQADLGASTKGLISVMNSYSFSADKAMFASDVFTRTVGAGVGSMDEFVSAMSPMAGLAASVGMKFDDLGTSIAFMTTKGATASLAATQTKAAIVALLNPNEKMTKLFTRMGVESGSAMIKQYGLAGALSQIKGALGGSSDAMAKVLGSTEALQGATTLTDEAFASFSATFASGLDGITKSAQAVQLEAYEAKMARLKSSQDAYAAKMGESSNRIKGFFADIKTGFLQMALPLMSTPLGDSLTPIVAALGLGAEKALGLGGAALNTASQMATLAAAAKNAGGIAGLLKGSFEIATVPAKMLGVGLGKVGMGFLSLGRGIVAALPSMGAWIASAWGAAAAHMAVAWPIYAVIAGVAALAAGVFLVIKNWGALSAFFTRLWTGVKNTFGRAFAFIWGFFDSKPVQILAAAFLPIIGIPILIAKNWGAISGFFANLWNGVKAIFSSAFTFIWGLFDNKAVQAAVAVFMPIVGIPMLIAKNWEPIKAFFANLWAGIQATASTVAGGVTLAWGGVQSFFTGIWNGVKTAFSSAFTFIWGLFDNKAVQAALVVFAPVVGIPTTIIKNWEPIKAFFSGLWSGITGIFQAAIAKIEGFFTGMWTAIQKPFKAIGDFFAKVFGGAFASGKASMDAFSNGIGQGSGTVTASTAKAFDAPAKYFPHSDAPVGPFSMLTSSGRSLMSTFAGGIGQAGKTVTRATAQAFSGPAEYFPHSNAPTGPFSRLTDSGAALMTTFAEGMDATPVQRELDTAFSGALSPVEIRTTTEADRGGEQKTATGQGGGQTVQHFHIEKEIVIQAENIKTALDFVEILMAAARVPA